MRLVVVGDALLDRDVSGTVERVCPDAPAPVVDVADERDRPGGAALAAALAAAAGHEVHLVAALGRGEAANRLRRLLDQARVALVELPTTGTTPEKVRVRCAGQTLLRLDRGGGRVTGAPPPAAHQVLASADAVLVADYGRGVTHQPPLRHAVAALAARTPLVWDPHPRGARPVPGCWLVTPNEREAAGAAPAPPTYSTALATLTARARQLVAQWSARGVAVTRGRDGALLVTDHGAPLAVPGAAVDATDACGAGDAFAAAAALALGERPTTLGEAVEQAVGAAGAFVARGGATSVHLDSGSAGPGADQAPVAAARPRRSGPTPLAEATAIVRRAQAGGGVVVATGGCFDLLHPGHVRLLRDARRLGDLLVVLVNADASVTRLKGPGRPVQPEQDRAAVLAAVDAVDVVVLFSEDTPVAALDQLRPDLFAKGGDYAATDLPETTALARWGGEVVVLPYLSGRSTTRLLEASRAR